jgi:hypothetical protein
MFSLTGRSSVVSFGFARVEKNGTRHEMDYQNYIHIRAKAYNFSRSSTLPMESSGLHGKSV